MLNAALKEINELKARLELINRKYLDACDDILTLFKYQQSSFETGEYRVDGQSCTELAKAMNQSPVQCLKQHDLDLLNSIKDEFINSNQSCELILASRINDLELDNEWVRKEKI